ncbi:putative disease resistance RPP13-like protein 1 [Rutidosis leptorrhynchoides]|uniref:putative disease resistance RPP13-like protein 1 n=1 Tax=Rutidosis leptorrhynchoides TaxID=125765 RepID=UPI003A9903D3
MAEIIAYDLVKAVLQKLASEAFKKIARSRGIQSELNNLKKRLFQIQNVLNDASQKEVTDVAVKEWLNSLQHLAYDIDDVLDDIATESMHNEFNQQDSVATTSMVRKLIPTCCTNFTLAERVSPKLDTIINKLQDLEKEKNDLGLVIVKQDRPKNMNRKLQTSLVDESKIIGRQVEKEELVQKLLRVESCDENYSVVPIVGMGGVGKTTLAKLLYNDNRVKDHFELKAWVCVSDDFDSIGISKAILQSMGGENKDFSNFSLLQEALKNQILGKRFMLVLDDVWSESYEDWETLVLPFHACARGSKIIMTTRKVQLLNKIGYDHIDQMKNLSNDEGLSLVALHALGENNFDLHPLLKPHGEDLVKKCGALPLALIALGRLLRTKEKEEYYWKQVLNSEIWRLKDGGEIVPALRLSYHDLSACLKRLFAYCSFFPKDYIFDKRELVLLWMAEGFLHHSTQHKSTEEHFGDECFEELLSRSFFQHAPNENRSLFVMHDLINDLGTSISGDFFVRLENYMEMDKGSEALKKYRHMSFVREEYEAYNKFKAFEKATSLRTFLATSVGVIDKWTFFFLSNTILVDLLPKLSLLRVLNLSNFTISEVPDTIGSLRHLRYLNLSRTLITQLPDNVCNLYNLQTLILFGCRELAKLPNNLSNLKNLHHIDIRETDCLNKMPLGIGKLKSLQTLSKIIIGGENGFRISELKKLNNLCEELSIEGLHEVQNAADVREVNFSKKWISELKVKWSDVFDDSRKEQLEKESLEEMKPHSDTLKKLIILSYGGIELPNWVVDPSFVRLSHVSIDGCKKCTRLPPLGQLVSLKELFIGGMDEVNYVGMEFIGTTTGVSFTSLKILSFTNMKGWESWSINCGDVFPCLEKLFIIRCPCLVKVSLKELPSLRQLEIRACGHNVLTSLVRIASSVTELELDSISGLTDEVWRGVCKHLRAVEELSISDCNEIRYLWESEAKASIVFACLRKLNVSYCDKLVRLGEREGDDDKSGGNLLLLTSLRILDISHCKNMEHCSCPNNIETLTIKSVRDISFSKKGGGQKLKTLYYFECEDEIQIINRNNNGMPLLQHVTIDLMPNLRIILELNCFLHLTSLHISNCESLESFPDQQLPHLPSLTTLSIIKCPRMDGSFPRGLWPPNLVTLKVGGLKKPISEWGPQNFPPSLVDVDLYGGSSENDVNSGRGRQLSSLLPSSLTSLRLWDFKELETISMGLEHLTSLQHLSIHMCPKLKDLPEMLLPSLLSLNIYKCPKLKERCSKSKSRIGGSHNNNWPLISHIPCISIDYKLL